MDEHTDLAYTAADMVCQTLMFNITQDEEEYGVTRDLFVEVLKKHIIPEDLKAWIKLNKPEWVSECKESALEAAHPLASRGIQHPGTGAS